MERVPAMAEEIVEQSENIDQMMEQSVSVDLDEVSSGVANLYGTGTILVVDKKSASIVFGNPLDFTHLTYA